MAAAIALGYAGAGAAVVLTRTTTEIGDTVRQIERNGGQGLAVTVDVAQQPSVEQLFQQAATHFGGIDIVVVNAGVSLDRRPIERASQKSGA
ncbi:MAG: SDR family oxidoreductase [Caldilineaceae bacterium]